MATKNYSFSYLTILVALTFLPAILVPLSYKNKTMSGSKLTAYALFVSFSTTLLLFFTQHQLLILALILHFGSSFLLWSQVGRRGFQS
ncbi:hypothetical protein CVU14713_06480 [Campylobacter vulpis]|nr:hypothetical protein [Campylobacter vulpis]PHY90889.1 hypothetical protein AA995_04930 [Campylobacter vulpis]